MRSAFQRFVIRVHSRIMWTVSERYRREGAMRDAAMRWYINQLALGFGRDYEDLGEGSSTWEGV